MRIGPLICNLDPEADLSMPTKGETRPISTIRLNWYDALTVINVYVCNNMFTCYPTVMFIFICSIIYSLFICKSCFGKNA